MFSNYPRRKRIRLENYDYSQSGAYFCTVCVHRLHKHKNLLASIEDGELQFNKFGNIVQACWEDIPAHRPSVTLDAFMVMPNHVHLIVFLQNDESSADVSTEPFKNQFGPQKSGSLGMVLGAFKSAVKRDITDLRGQPTEVWQPRFYEHVVRSEAELRAIRLYIENNPSRWLEDRCHPKHPDFEATWNNQNPDPIDFI